MSTNNAWNTPDLLLDGQLLIGQTGDRPLANVPAGDTDEISITPGPGTVNIGIADNPIIPGNESITQPIGTTLQRPGTPVEGMQRYNSTLDVMEAYSNSGWKVFAYDSGFLGSLGANLTNLTGDGTVYTIVFPSVSSVRAGQYNTSTGAWEPNVNGLFVLGGTLMLQNVGAGHNNMNITLSGAPGGFNRVQQRMNLANVIPVSGNGLAVNFCAVINAGPSFTAPTFSFFVEGSTATVGLQGNPGVGLTTIWGSFCSTQGQ